MAFKVEGNFTDNQYKCIYFNARKQERLNKVPNIYAPITAVKLAENKVKPGYVQFLLDPLDTLIFPSENDLSVKDRCCPINIMEKVSTQVGTDPPNMISTRYRYDKAVAQTLE